MFRFPEPDYWPRTYVAVGCVAFLLAAVLMPLSSLTVVLSSSFSRTFTRPAGRAATRSTRDPLGA